MGAPAGRRTRRALLAGVLALLLSLLAGCAGNGGVSEVQPPPTPPAAAPEPPHVLVSLLEQAPARLEPRLTQTYDRPVTAALSDDGSTLIVGRSFGRIRHSTHWGAAAYDLGTGQELWSRTYRAAVYRTIEVAALGPQPWLAVGVYTYGNTGTLHVYRRGGQEVWSRQVVSSTLLSADGAGERIFGMDLGRWSMFAVEAASGRELGTARAERGTFIQVARDGQALAFTGSSLILFTRDGRVVTRWAARQDFADVGFAADGAGVFASTGGSDSTVYRFDPQGQLVWQLPLPHGGSNSLAVSPDGSHLVAYNVGIEHGLAIIDAASGKLLRRNSFAAVENATRQFVRGVYFVPAGGHVIDYALVRDRAAGHAEERFLLRLDSEGRLAARMDLGSNVDVLLSADCLVCVTIDNRLVEAGGVNRLRVFDLGPWLSPR